MQKQCFHILLVVDDELKRMAVTRLGVMKRREEMVQLREGSSRVSGGWWIDGATRRTKDLADPGKWGVMNLDMFRLTLGEYTRVLDVVYAGFERQRKGLREVQSNLLKGVFFSF